MKTAALFGGGGADADRKTTEPSFSTTSAARPSSPCRRLDVVLAEIVAGLRRRRAAEHLHRLGPRPALEAMIEIAAGADLDATLARYARLDPDIVDALGGDDFPPQPLHEVRQ